MARLHRNTHQVVRGGLIDEALPTGIDAQRVRLGAVENKMEDRFFLREFFVFREDDQCTTPVLFSARIGARLQKALGDRRIDVLLAAPNLREQAIHRVARETGIEL